jgi:hypothetical protein
MDQEHVKLREYIEKILDEREKALKLTADNLEHRLAHLNEWKDATLKERSDFVSKEMHNVVERDIAELRDFRGKVIGYGLAISSISGLIGALIAHLIK